MAVPRITVDLDRPPRQRWDVLAPQVDAARALMRAYTRDLGLTGDMASLLAHYLDAHVQADFREELEGVAEVLGCSVLEAATGNLYYDALKLVLGCTAVSTDGPDGPIHARNLDWWSDDGALARYTAIFDFYQDGKLAFTTVGWPGFIG
ncbi:MAG: hypothetical protein H6730_34950, partial [Deltaproteobacteria bacterium]|nr:hypothetical protein [Deltaproteobacteria bacterium]